MPIENQPNVNEIKKNIAREIEDASLSPSAVFNENGDIIRANFTYVNIFGLPDTSSVVANFFDNTRRQKDKEVIQSQLSELSIYDSIPSSEGKEYKKYIADIVQPIFLSSNINSTKLELHWFKWRCEAKLVNGQKYYFAQGGVDITDIKKAQIEAEEMSKKDLLTGIGNQNAYEEKIRQLTDDPTIPFLVILFDLHDMKKTNDNLGHPEGDRLLKSMANALKNAFRYAPNSIYRKGGDEFSVIIDNDFSRTSVKEMIKRLEKFRDEINESNKKEGFEPEVGFGVGFATRHNGESAIDIIKKADDALNREKKKYHLTHPRAST
jgi:diguanylate cyclase (GGDEF)-like protein